MTEEAFHEGEQAVQERAGVRRRLQLLGPRVIRDYMTDQHREFFAQLPFLLAGSVDERQQPWSSILAGPPGFITSPSGHRLRIEASPLPGDPLRERRSADGAAGIIPGMAIGLLGIELHTRRRNRMNGHVDNVDATGFEIAVGQSFGNCPKYIQARQADYVAERADRARRRNAVARRAAGLDESARALIARSDTFFIASAHPRQGVDVSHRGGPPGFVRVAEDGSLVAPEYAGNDFFNTLGNLAVNPRAGLLFPDFDAGDCLHVGVRASIVWEPDEVSRFEGALRLLRFEVLEVRMAQDCLPLRWGPVEMSPYLPGRGGDATMADRR